MPQAVKPGIKTTEFWIALVAAVIPPIIAAGYITEEQIAAAVVVASPILSSMGYSISRGLAKGGGRP